MAAWAVTGLPMSHAPQLSAEELQEAVLSRPGAVIVDTRAPAEYRRGHVPRSISIQVADLRTRYSELDRSAETVVVCSTGNRSSLGASMLLQKGFTNVKNAAGGVSGFAAAGCSLVQS